MSGAAEPVSLASLLEQHRRVDAVSAANLVIAICRALEQVEIRGGISPARILISAAGGVTVGGHRPSSADLGYVAPELVAHARSPDRPRPQMTRNADGSLVGYIRFDRPVIAQEPARVFALGVMLWELRMGRRLFESALSDHHTMVLAGEAHVPPLDAPPELDAIVRTALAKSVADRYQTPRELGDALQRWLADIALN